MSKVLLKAGEAARELDENIHTLRNWVRDFRPHIPLEKDEGSGYNMYGEEALSVLRTIKKLIREQGYSTRQVEYYLSGQGGYPDAEPVSVSDLAEIKDMLQQQKDFNAELVKRLDQQQQYIEKALQARDESLTQTLRQMQIQRLEEAKRPWWKKLF
jgi:DNA-binding transcriptional MerR regulator